LGKTSPKFTNGEHLKLWEAINGVRLEQAKMKKDIEWIKKNMDRMENTFGSAYGKISHRMWWVLGSVVALGLMGILTNLITSAL